MHTERNTKIKIKIGVHKPSNPFFSGNLIKKSYIWLFYCKLSCYPSMIIRSEDLPIIFQLQHHQIQERHPGYYYVICDGKNDVTNGVQKLLQKSGIGRAPSARAL